MASSFSAQDVFLSADNILCFCFRPFFCSVLFTLWRDELRIRVGSNRTHHTRLRTLFMWHFGKDVCFVLWVYLGSCSFMALFGVLRIIVYWVFTKIGKLLVTLLYMFTSTRGTRGEWKYPVQVHMQLWHGGWIYKKWLLSFFCSALLYLYGLCFLLSHLCSIPSDIALSEPKKIKIL